MNKDPEAWTGWVLKGLDNFLRIFGKGRPRKHGKNMKDRRETLVQLHLGINAVYPALLSWLLWNWQLVKVDKVRQSHLYQPQQQTSKCRTVWKINNIITWQSLFQKTPPRPPKFSQPNTTLYPKYFYRDICPPNSFQSQYVILIVSHFGQALSFQNTWYYSLYFSFINITFF